ncbi:hypothetical protein [Micromonospora harpali]|uniref:hypothetical protein n=1 Tax=Micromonospora harpali TaxID=1490225 RepID=UPI00366BCC05
MVDLPVQVDDAFEFLDRLVEVTVIPTDHRNVVTSGGFADPVAGLPATGQGLHPPGPRRLAQAG